MGFWTRGVVFAVSVAMLAFAGYGLWAMASASVAGLVAEGAVLAGWVAVYLIFGRRLAAQIRKGMGKGS